MHLLPDWLKSGVSTNFEPRLKATLDAIMMRLGQIAEGFTAIETNITLNPNQTTVFRGSYGMPVRWVAGTYSIVAADCVILASASTGAFTISLLSPTQYDGQVFFIKKVDSTLNSVLIAGTLDGAQRAITTQYTCYMIVAGSSTWNII